MFHVMWMVYLVANLAANNLNVANTNATKFAMKDPVQMFVLNHAWWPSHADIVVEHPVMRVPVQMSLVQLESLLSVSVEGGRQPLHAPTTVFPR